MIPTCCCAFRTVPLRLRAWRAFRGGWYVPLEICKYVTRQELGKRVDLKFLRLEGADHDIIFTYPEGGQMQLLSVGFNVYEDCCAIVGRNPSLTAGLQGLVKIDREWVEQFIA